MSSEQPQVEKAYAENPEKFYNDQFVKFFSAIQKRVNKTAHEKGWYDKDDALKAINMPEDLRKYVGKLANMTRIALMHSELSEGLEGERKDLNDDKIPQFTMMEAELADTIIRIMDFCEENHLKVADALIAKASFNTGRAYRHGNKAF
jgi:hypothetical protein